MPKPISENKPRQQVIIIDGAPMWAEILDSQSSTMDAKDTSTRSLSFSSDASQSTKEDDDSTKNIPSKKTSRSLNLLIEKYNESKTKFYGKKDGLEKINSAEYIAYIAARDYMNNQSKTTTKKADEKDQYSYLGAQLCKNLTRDDKNADAQYDNLFKAKEAFEAVKESLNQNPDDAAQKAFENAKEEFAEEAKKVFALLENKYEKENKQKNEEYKTIEQDFRVAAKELTKEMLKYTTLIEDRIKEELSLYQIDGQDVIVMVNMGTDFPYNVANLNFNPVSVHGNSCSIVLVPPDVKILSEFQAVASQTLAIMLGTRASLQASDTSSTASTSLWSLMSSKFTKENKPTVRQRELDKITKSKGSVSPSLNQAQVECVADVIMVVSAYQANYSPEFYQKLFNEEKFKDFMQANVTKESLQLNREKLASICSPAINLVVLGNCADESGLGSFNVKNPAVTVSSISGAQVPSYLQ